MNSIPTDSALANVLQQYQGIDPVRVHLTESVAAACLGQKSKTLESWRRDGRELPFIKLGRSIRYRLSDVLACIDRNTFRSSREARTRDRRIPTPKKSTLRSQN